jgi:eukaryotic-like serine/threonine-protein kinase
MPFEVGETVGPYRIVAVAGRGGMGQVFQVQHSVTGQVEALKVLLADRSDEEQAQRFLREIQVQAGLHHPNIAAVHHAFWEGDRLVMAMEWIEGPSLEHLLERGRLPLPEALNYARQALAALGCAHSQGITHRDVKPSNMLLTPEGALKLTDFGLARDVKDRKLSQSGALLGSCYYMSPEQIRGLARLDHRSDLYSLGVVLYEMTTGRKPFEGASAFELLSSHVHELPQPPRHLAPEMPASLNDAILTALAKDPQQRFQTAEEFRQALDAAAAPRSPGRPPVGRWGFGVAAAAVILVVSLANLWLRTRSPVPSPSPPDAALSPPPVTSGRSRPAPATKRSLAPSPPSHPANASVAEPTPSPDLPPSQPALVDPVLPAPAAPTAQPAALRLLPGTLLVIRTVEMLSTKTNHAGDTFLARLEQPLTASGQVIAAPGATVEGRIVEAEEGGRLVGRAHLSIELYRLHVAGGLVVPIATGAVEQEARGPKSRMILLKRGVPAVLPPDTILDFQLQSAVTLK